MAGGWESLGLMEELIHKAEIDFDWTLPTAIQEECIPLILNGSDVMASAETGSGKTAAFAFPTIQICHERKILQHLHENGNDDGEIITATTATATATTSTHIRNNDNGNNKNNNNHTKEKPKLNDDTKSNSFHNHSENKDIKPCSHSSSSSHEDDDLPKIRMSENDRDKHVAIDPHLHPYPRGDSAAAAAASGAGKFQKIQSFSILDDGKKEWGGCRCTHGIDTSRAKGSWYFECTIHGGHDDSDPHPHPGQGGLVRVGYSALGANLTTVGADKYGWGYGATGTMVHDNRYQTCVVASSSSSSAAASPCGEMVVEMDKKKKANFGPGDTIGCLLVLGNNKFTRRSKSKSQKDAVIPHKIIFTKNGSRLEPEFTIPKHFSHPLFPTVSIQNSECSLNFGSRVVVGTSSSSSSSFVYQPREDEPRVRPFGSLTKDDGGVVSPCLRSQLLSSSSVVASPSPSASSNHNDDNSYDPQGPLAILIEPTRDLAEQVHTFIADTANKMKNPTLSTGLLMGGIDNEVVLSNLEQNDVDILVGTLSILSFLVQEGKIKTSRCKLFVIDEADGMIRNTENVRQINVIHSSLFKGTNSGFDRLQVCFFSATLRCKEVQSLTSRICHRPVWIELKDSGGGGHHSSSTMPQSVRHFFISVDPNNVEVQSYFEKDDDDANDESILSITPTTDSVHRGGNIDANTDLSVLSDKERDSEKIKIFKFHVLREIIEILDMDQVLVFCRTNLDCELVERFLLNSSDKSSMTKDKFSCCILSSTKSMTDRRRNLQAFRNGEKRILICTDLASRGIDISGLPFVVNMTLPDRQTSETYIHRSGRVGRAFGEGSSISIISKVKEKVWFCQKGLKPPCSNTDLFENKGNCIWLNELSLSKEVEKLFKRESKTHLQTCDWPVPAHILSSMKYNDNTHDQNHESNKSHKSICANHKIDSSELLLQSEFLNLRYL